MKKLLCRAVVILTPALVLGILWDLPWFPGRGLTGEAFYGEKVTRIIIGTTSWSGLQMNLSDTALTNLQMIFSHEGLVRYRPNGEVGPGLAESWETPDLKTWVFRMAGDARWHDGHPVTSRDVAFTIHYTYEKDFAYGKSVYHVVGSTETPDERTLVIHLKQADANFPTQLANMPYTLPEHLFKTVAAPEALDDLAVMHMGTGPYRFAGFDKLAGVVRFRANDRYWGGFRPTIDEIEIRLYNNPDALVLAFAKGQVDLPYVYLKGIDYFYVPRLIENKHVRIMRVKNPGINNALWFNTERPPLDVVGLRRAIRDALDYDELARLFTAGYGAPPEAGFVPGGTAYHVSKGVLTRSVERARPLLDELGFRDADGDGVREGPDGSRLPLELLFTSTSENTRCAGLLMKYLKDVGLDLRLKAVDSGTLQAVIETDRSHRMVLHSAPYWAFSDYRGHFTAMVDSRFYGYANVRDPAFHRLVDRLGLAGNPEVRRSLLHELQDYYAEQVPMIALYSMDMLQPYHRKLSGWEIDPLWGILSHGTFANLCIEPLE